MPTISHALNSLVVVCIVVTKVFDYKRFPDPHNGEWFGYLNRRGAPPLAWCNKSPTHAHTALCGGGVCVCSEVLVPLKGGNGKGCFHLCAKIFQQLHDEQQQQPEPSV
jgi:N-acylglucosamine 2-epimerase